jgi:uncharacterized protein
VSDDLDGKLARLEQILKETGGCVVAYSGGVDSTFLAAVAHTVLGGKALAVNALSETYVQEEAELARAMAEQMGLNWRQITTSELECAAFRANPPDRCYHCKKELFGRLTDIARSEGIPCVADGTNVDDQDDYRPGEKASAELGVRHPLREAGMTKDDIRALSRRMSLPTWDRPAAACLASRFPYGEQITAEKLTRVARAEKYLRDLGYRVSRVRSHGDSARIEVEAERIGKLARAHAAAVAARLKEFGFTYVGLDLEGYRTGSMNEALPGVTGPREDG